MKPRDPNPGPRARPRMLFRAGVALLVAAGIGITAFFWGAHALGLPADRLAAQLQRIAAAPVLAIAYRSDLDRAQELKREYQAGAGIEPAEARRNWDRLGGMAGVRVVSIEGRVPSYDIPFVHQHPDSDYLAAFRSRYRLEEMIEDAASEYESMLRIATWVGSRWDHGTDTVPGGNLVCDPVAVVESGASGRRYWCEIAARTMVHAATSLGWPARAVTASRDGYTWEHAVAELWSNEFGKWFAVDPDFNVIYEADGVPLSAFELTHSAEQLAREGRLDIRRIGIDKASLPLVDLLPFYRYVHVDLRNDWCTRKLRRGSPAGGDRNTWWTARADLGPIATAMQRVDAPDRFDWPVNAAMLDLVAARVLGNGGVEVQLRPLGYSPFMREFEMNVDGAEWRGITPEGTVLELSGGEHSVAVRMRSGSGGHGPQTILRLQVGDMGPFGS